MSKLRDAAQQALEALENHAKQYPHMQKGYTVDAITALRTALAEPDHFVDASNMVAEPCEMGAMCLNCQPRGPNGECPDAPQPKAEQPAEQQPLTREEIFELAEPFGEFKYGDAQGHKRIDFANAIIAAYERINVYAAPQPAKRERLGETK